MHEVCLLVPPGPLGLKLQPGPHNLGAVVKRFVRRSPGPGPVELHGGVAVGSLLTQVDELCVSNLPVSEVVALLRARTTHPKRLVFSLSLERPATATSSRSRSAVAEPLQPQARRYCPAVGRASVCVGSLCSARAQASSRTRKRLVTQHVRALRLLVRLCASSRPRTPPYQRYASDVLLCLSLLGVADSASWRSGEGFAILLMRRSVSFAGRS